MAVVDHGHPRIYDTQNFACVTDYARTSARSWAEVYWGKTCTCGAIFAQASDGGSQEVWQGDLVQTCRHSPPEAHLSYSFINQEACNGPVRQRCVSPDLSKVIIATGEEGWTDDEFRFEWTQLNIYDTHTGVQLWSHVLMSVDHYSCLWRCRCLIWHHDSQAFIFDVYSEQPYVAGQIWYAEASGVQACHLLFAHAQPDCRGRVLDLSILSYGKIIAASWSAVRENGTVYSPMISLLDWPSGQELCRLIDDSLSTWIQNWAGNQYACLLSNAGSMQPD